MDDTDRQLIALLRDNARMPVIELARRLGVARTTVQQRLARLERDGVIAGYTVRLQSEERLPQVRAMTCLAVEGHREQEVVRALRGNAHVAMLHTTSGRWDLIAELRVDRLEAVDGVLNLIRVIPGVTHTETHILLAACKL
ncbi:MAG: Lrp/AsnC family transcriptional regulator [Lautropia sp.]|nr:Lrp/AsnC family transcriptional regulator [Lautropia sp.]